jgi:hypothetical protein
LCALLLRGGLLARGTTGIKSFPSEEYRMKRYTMLTIIAVTATGMLVFWPTQRDWLIGSLWWQKAEGALIDQRYRQRSESPRIRTSFWQGWRRVH